jgi:hypothetical protein
MNVTGFRLQFVTRPLAARQTTCEFAITIDGLTVWPAYGVEEALLEVQIDDILGYLTEFWQPLMLRQVYPIAVTPSWPSELRRMAERRWEGLPRSTVEIEEERVADFEEAHDISRCFSGIFGLPSFWIFRSGGYFLIETANRIRKLPFEDVLEGLRALGDTICNRLAEADELHWSEAIEAWRFRNRADSTGLLAWSAGLDRSLARELIEEGILEAPLNFDDAASDNDELRIAARMAGALSPEQIRKIIWLAREFDRYDDHNLKDLTRKCADFIADGHGRDRPFQQGEAAANFVRDQLELPPGRVDIFKIVSSLGLVVRHKFAEPSTLDGLAVWGSRHGPGVFLNEASRRIHTEGEDIAQVFGARVTLAHEFCHLLLDGGHALTAIEVLNARMPAGVEQRAKSFAGEFLLPTSVAAQRWVVSDSPGDRKGLDELLKELTETFGVTWSVAAWKLEHAARAYNVDLGPILDTLAPYR